MSYTTSSQEIDPKTIASAIGGIIVLIALYWIFIGFGASISQEEYVRLRNGMSYQQVVEIVGGKGDLIMDANVMGMSTRGYRWHGSGMESVMVSFDGDRLTAKMIIP